MESNLNPSQFLFEVGKQKGVGPEDMMSLCPNNEKMEVVDRHRLWRAGRSRVMSSQAVHHCVTVLRNMFISALSPPSCGDRCEPLLSMVQRITVPQNYLKFRLGLSLSVSFGWCCSYFRPSSLKECFVFLQSLGQRSWWLPGHSQRTVLKPRSLRSYTRS